jgi:molybdenum cofactor biosynthesis enzyme
VTPFEPRFQTKVLPYQSDSRSPPELILLCHPLSVSSVNIDFEPDKERSCVLVRATVRIFARTGVEMEALNAVAAAGLKGIQQIQNAT